MTPSWSSSTLIAGTLLIIILPSTLVFLDAAAAQPNTSNVAAGRSLSGTMTCPNGDSVSATLVLGVEQYHDYRGLTGIAGNYRIFAPYLVGEIQGVLTDGHVGEKSFRVTGSEDFVGGCNTLISDVVISGKCGTDATVTYRAEDKVIGRFMGEVECFTRQSA